jgi:ubiquinol-cytochrome c reductase iron-sulfur subunit
MADTEVPAMAEDDEGESRRDFIALATAAVGVAGAGLAAWPFVDSLNPSADVRALGSIEVDVSAVEEGQAVTVTWRGKPVFIRHRTEDEIKAARAEEAAALPHPETDEQRVQRPKWLVMIGVCTHLGCIPSGQKEGDSRGEFGGWFCPCHGSHYDTAGRVRKGPAPQNLAIPPYAFLDDKTIKIG